MMFASGLKRFCDVLFYLTFASMVASIIGGDRFMIVLPIFAVIVFLLAILAPFGWIKYIAMLPGGLIFLLLPMTIPNLILLIPLLIYLLWSAPKREDGVLDFDYASVFWLFLAIFGFIFVLSLMLGAWVDQIDERFQDGVVFALMFLLMAINFMRLIRHDALVLKQFKFKVMNTISLIALLIAVIFMSNQRVLNFVFSIISFVITTLWHYVLGPIILFIFWLIMLVVTLLSHLFSPSGFADMALPDMQMMMGPSEIDTLDAMSYGNEHPLLRTILIVIGGLIGIVMLVCLFKTLTAKLSSTMMQTDDVTEERISLDRDGKKNKRKFGRNKENAIRETYRDFITLLEKAKISVPLHLTSEEIHQLTVAKFTSKYSEQLRELYLRVRYKQAIFTKAEVKRAKELYKLIKLEIEQSDE